MSDILWLDTETQSRADLKSVGAYNYAAHPSTKLLCIAFAFNDDPVQVWSPGKKLPPRVAGFKGQIRAFNAGFDRLVMKHQGFAFSPTQWYCVAAQARANCFPGNLADVARFAGTDMRKDHRGAFLIRKLCIPDDDGNFSADAGLLDEMYAYAAQDVRTMREVSKAMRELAPDELADYHTNERINDRGIRLDTDLARGAVKYSDAEVAEIKALIVDITHGQVTSPKSPKLREWVFNRLPTEEARALMVNGKGKFSMDKTVRANLLAYAEEHPNEIDPETADVIQCADDAAASSTAKFQKLLGLANVDDHRVRGAFVFAGGAATGRASSYGAQLHNFPRKTIKDSQTCRDHLVRGLPITPAFGSRVTDVLKGMLRPALVASPGNVLVVADWSSIEARVTPWASNSDAGERKLTLFRNGADVYRVNAASTFGVAVSAVDDHQRQVGKVQELSCGFAGGVGAFAAMGRAYNVSMSEADADRMVKAWRRANPWAAVYWSDLESTYTRAMRNPGKVFAVGRVQYYFDGVHLWYCLPSERVLCYPFAKLDADGVSYAKCSWKPAADAKKWPRGRLWKGLACENITQAIAADILRESLRRLEADGVIAHVHDEIVIECVARDAGYVEAAMRLAMTTPPEWADGLPLGVEIKSGMLQYGK